MKMLPDMPGLGANDAGCGDDRQRDAGALGPGANTKRPGGARLRRSGKHWRGNAGKLAGKVNDGGRVCIAGVQRLYLSQVHNFLMVGVKTDAA